MSCCFAVGGGICLAVVVTLGLFPRLFDGLGVKTTPLFLLSIPRPKKKKKWGGGARKYLLLRVICRGWDTLASEGSYMIRPFPASSSNLALHHLFPEGLQLQTCGFPSGGVHFKSSVSIRGNDPS